MSNRFNVFQTGLTLKEAVELIRSTRKSAQPEDFRVESSQVRFDGVGLVINGNRYALTEASTAAMCKLLDLDGRTLAKLSPVTQVAVVNELISKRTGRMYIRTAAGDGPKVRTILKSKFNVVDDCALFGRLLTLAANWDDVPVSVWISEGVAAIRVFISELPQSTISGGVQVGFGFDVANSELAPQAAWARGLIMLGENRVAMVTPRVLTSKNSGSIDVISQWVSEFVAADFEAVDATVCAGLPVGGRQVTVELAHLLENKLISGQESAKIRAILQESNVTALKLSEAVSTLAASMDHYNKRAALEFIPNLWCRSSRLVKGK